MTEQSKRRVTWLRAFWLVFKGGPEELGKGYKWKSGLLIIALVWTVGIPIIGEILRSCFLGALPPEAPLIKATGLFVHKFAQAGIRKVPYMEFRADDGRIYLISRPANPDGLEQLARSQPPVRVYAEGFLLRDGEGSYWPTAIRTVYGIDLIPPQQLYDSLQRARNPWNLYVVMYLLASVFWVPSIVNAYRLKVRLSSKEM